MPVFEVDAVVVGGGHHGLVAAAVLADAGWDVLPARGAGRAGRRGPLRGAAPGVRRRPVQRVLPARRGLARCCASLELDQHGLRWAHAPGRAGPPAAPGRRRRRGPAPRPGAHRGRRSTSTTPATARRGCALCAPVADSRGPLLRTLFTAFPPVRGPAQLLRRIGTADALRLLRFLLLPATRMGEELFGGEPARLLLAGNAAHADVPVAGAGQRRCSAGCSRCSASTTASRPRRRRRASWPRPWPGGRRSAGAGSAPASRSSGSSSAAAGPSASRPRAGTRCGPAGRSSPTSPRPPSTSGCCPRRGARPAARRPRPASSGTPRRSRSTGRWTAPIPWRAATVLRGAGTVHLGADSAGLVRWSADLETGTLPASPFLLLGQMTTTDPTRSPAGTEAAWAYTHLPRGVDDDAVGRRPRPRASRPSSRRTRPASATGSCTASCNARPTSPPPTPTSATARSTAARRSCSSSWCSARCPGLGRPETPIERPLPRQRRRPPRRRRARRLRFLAAKAALAAHGRRASRRRITSAALDLVYGP